MRPEDSDQGIDLNADPELESESESESSVACSICLDLVSYGEDRSRAKLQCGHQFHLDCIGSAFNIKGKMQCPNCRKIEKGRWFYTNGSTNSSPEFSMDDGSIDNNPVFFSFTEMPYRIHICPYRGLTYVHPSSESSLGIMGTLNPMLSHPRPGRSHPHGWVHFQHAPYHHHQQSSSVPMPIGVSRRLESPRILPRFMPPGQMYDPNPGFSHYAEGGLSMNYAHTWGRDYVPRFP